MKLQDCPVHHTLRFIGGKWKPIILYYLKEGTKRSSELARQIPEVSGKVLTEQLRELERDGIIQRTVFATVPPTVEYSLTELGLTLRPVLRALAEWGGTYGSKNTPMPACSIDSPSKS
ncbi:MAG: helix-turn-helix domain-containing protein [Verrucomicrobia bacterium]|nr:helix-turn-helix domain-containing protein [Verrucomicrobiota bacterium]